MDSVVWEITRLIYQDDRMESGTKQMSLTCMAWKIPAFTGSNGLQHQHWQQVSYMFYQDSLEVTSSKVHIDIICCRVRAHESGNIRQKRCCTDTRPQAVYVRTKAITRGRTIPQIKRQGWETMTVHPEVRSLSCWKLLRGSRHV